MIRADWKDRRPGVLGFVAGDSALDDLIRDAERAINPVTAGHLWIPTHVFVFGPRPSEVTEASWSFTGSSAAATHPESEYDGFFERGAMQLWRPEAPAGICERALGEVIRALQFEPYSLLNLLGFGFEALVRFAAGARIDNPVDFSYVCSQTVLAYVRMVNSLGAAEPWCIRVKERDCSPDVLLLAIVAATQADGG